MRSGALTFACPCTQAAPVKPEILVEDDVMTVAALGPYCLGYWRGLPDVESFRHMHTQVTAWSAPLPHFVAVNVVRVRSLTSVSDELRKEMARVQDSFAGKQLGLATVIAERGFVAAAVRAVTSGVQLLSRGAFPQRVFSSVDDGTAWAVSLLDAGIPAATVASALEELGTTAAR
jgi:hypothetical protein